MRSLTMLFVAGALVAAAPAAAQHHWDWPTPEPQTRHVDSGSLSNASILPKVVHSEVIHQESAGWMRLYFGDVQLDQGSFLRITSMTDGQIQELDAAGLAQWGNTSAYFNGDSLVVQLVAGAQTQKNRLVLERIAFEAAAPTAGCDPGCCGPTDDRVASDEDWSSRLLPAGCTASIYNTDSCAVSAGHCAGAGMVMEFKVPLSSPSCALNHPPVADQFPVSSYLFTNAGIGNDWLAMKVGTNNLGQKPFQRYGALKPIGSNPQVGQPATVWGYGVDDLCTVTQTQQTSSGDLAYVDATSIRYSIDVTYGNSGSGVVRSGSEIVGIVTNCCCPNWGTNIELSSFAAARENLCPSSPPQPGSITGLTVLTGNPTGGVADITASDNAYLAVASVTQGSRNNTNMLVTLQSPQTSVSQLNVTAEVGAANASPVFLGLSLFNYDTSAYDSIHFSTVSTTSDQTIQVNAVANPNAYVSPTGEVKLRITQTARQPQTPSGFTELIDYVGISVLP